MAIEKQNNNKRIAKNTFVLYVRMLLVMVINLYTTRALLAALGINDYGLYNVVCGFVSMFNFLNTSMSNGIQRFYSYEIGKKELNGISKIYTHALLIQIILSIIIITCIETFGIWYLNNKMVIPLGRSTAAGWIFQCSMINLFFVVISVPFSAAIMAYEKMGFYAYLSIFDTILKLVIVIFLPFMPHDHLVWYGSLIAGISIINYFLNYLFCKIKISDLKIDKKLDKNVFLSILSFSGWNFFGSFANMFRVQGLNLVYNFFWGTIINAANGIAGQVNAAIESLTNSFLVAVRPQMIKSYAAGEIDYMINMTYSVSKLSFYLVMILAVPMIWEISTVLDIWLGKGQYPEITVIFCQLTILMTLLGSFATPISIIIHATGKMKKFQIVISILTLLVVPVAYIFSTIGESAIFVLVLAIIFVIATQIARIYIVREIIDFSIKRYVVEVIVPASMVCSAAMLFTFGIHVLLPQGFITSLAVVTLGGIISSVLIFFVGLNSSERNLLLSFIHKK